MQRNIKQFSHNFHLFFSNHLLGWAFKISPATSRNWRSAIWALNPWKTTNWEGNRSDDGRCALSLAFGRRMWTREDAVIICVSWKVPDVVCEVIPNVFCTLLQPRFGLILNFELRSLILMKMTMKIWAQSLWDWCRRTFESPCKNSWPSVTASTR